MITYEEAYEKAKKVKSDIDFCTEYDNAYMFETDLSYLAEDEYLIGGLEMPTIILKENGDIVNMPTFMMIIKPGKEIGRIPLPE